MFFKLLQLSHVKKKQKNSIIKCLYYIFIYQTIVSDNYFVCLCYLRNAYLLGR